MFRLLGALAAVAPALLSALIPGETCGHFGYELPEPGLTETVVWEGAWWAVTLLPVALALLALWVPRRLPVLGAVLAAVALVLTSLRVVVPYNGICGRQQGDWIVPVCTAIVLAALLLSRRERRHAVPWTAASMWSVVLLIVLARMLTAGSSGDDLGCWATLQGTWALVQMHFFTAEAVGVWVGVAAVGAVLAGKRAAWVLGLVLLVPALYEPMAQVVSSAPHDCSGLLELIAWPYLVAGLLGVAAAVFRRGGSPRIRP